MAANEFTNAPKRPPQPGARLRLTSPVLYAYGQTKNTTMGQVVSITETGPNELNRCEVYFRGAIYRATCCHPGIVDGMNVCMIEQPIGVWWATVMQKSWYSRLLSEISDKGKPYAAAVEYLLSKGAKWRPTLIIIDKRGEQQEQPEIPYEPPIVGPDMVLGYDRSSWPYRPELFDIADTNGDGFVSAEELAAWLLGGGKDETPTQPDKNNPYRIVFKPDEFGAFGPNSIVEWIFSNEYLHTDGILYKVSSSLPYGPAEFHGPSRSNKDGSYTPLWIWGRETSLTAYFPYRETLATVTAPTFPPYGISLGYRTHVGTPVYQYITIFGQRVW